LGIVAEGWAAWVVAAVPAVLGGAAIVAYLRFLRMTDELNRMIQVQGLAVGFGVWFLLTMSWKLFERAGAGPLPDGVTLVVPLVAMSCGVVYFRRKY
jgi:hypothetical protein